MEEPITQAQIEELHNTLNLSDDFEFRAYSGRGMYGAECLAVVTSVSAWELLKGLTELKESQSDDLGYVHPQFQEFADLLDALIDHEPLMDTMGLSDVYYWPNITIQEN